MAVGPESGAASAAAQPKWLVELERLERLVETLVEERDRLAKENRELRLEMERTGGQRADHRLAMKALDEERRTWEGQRQAVADRIEVILGKFQWLESQSSHEAASAVAE